MKGLALAPPPQTHTSCMDQGIGGYAVCREITATAVKRTKQNAFILKYAKHDLVLISSFKNEGAPFSSIYILEVKIIA